MITDIDLARAHRLAARKLRETAAIHETQAREYTAVGNVLGAARCQEMCDDLVLVAEELIETARKLNSGEIPDHG